MFKNHTYSIRGDKTKEIIGKVGAPSRYQAALLFSKTKKLTLIEANKYYVFDYIDPPVVMEKKSEPNRSLICIFSALLGGMLGILLVLLRYYIFSVKTS